MNSWGVDTWGSQQRGAREREESISHVVTTETSPTSEGGVEMGVALGLLRLQGREGPDTSLGRGRRWMTSPREGRLALTSCECQRRTSFSAALATHTQRSAVGPDGEAPRCHLTPTQCRLPVRRPARTFSLQSPQRAPCSFMSAGRFLPGTPSKLPEFSQSSWAFMHTAAFRAPAGQDAVRPSVSEQSSNVAGTLPV